MRKFNLLSILALAITFLAVSCTKEGPEGPAGANGAQGPAGATGPQGPTGTANVIYSTWTTITALEAAIPAADTTHPDYPGTIRRWIRPAPGVTQAILDQGVIISYWRVGGSTAGVVSLPYTYYSGAATAPAIIGQWGAVGKIIYFRAALNGASTSVGLNGGGELRYVIIPGGVAGGRGNNEKVAEINGQLYSESQLKAMSYAQICSLLKIAQ